MFINKLILLALSKTVVNLSPEADLINEIVDGDNIENSESIFLERTNDWNGYRKNLRIIKNSHHLTAKKIFAKKTTVKKFLPKMTSSKNTHISPLNLAGSSVQLDDPQFNTLKPFISLENTPSKPLQNSGVQIKPHAINLHTTQKQNISFYKGTTLPILAPAILAPAILAPVSKKIMPEQPHEIEKILAKVTPVIQEQKHEMADINIPIILALEEGIKLEPAHEIDQILAIDNPVIQEQKNEIIINLDIPILPVLEEEIIPEQVREKGEILAIDNPVIQEQKHEIIDLDIPMLPVLEEEIIPEQVREIAPAIFKNRMQNLMQELLARQNQPAKVIAEPIIHNQAPEIEPVLPANNPIIKNHMQNLMQELLARQNQPAKVIAEPIIHNQAPEIEPVLPANNPIFKNRMQNLMQELLARTNQPKPVIVNTVLPEAPQAIHPTIQTNMQNLMQELMARHNKPAPILEEDNVPLPDMEAQLPPTAENTEMHNILDGLAQEFDVLEGLLLPINQEADIPEPGMEAPAPPSEIGAFVLAIDDPLKPSDETLFRTFVIHEPKPVSSVGIDDLCQISSSSSAPRPSMGKRVSNFIKNGVNKVKEIFKKPTSHHKDSSTVASSSQPIETPIDLTIRTPHMRSASRTQNKKVVEKKPIELQELISSAMKKRNQYIPSSSPVKGGTDENDWGENSSPNKPITIEIIKSESDTQRRARERTLPVQKISPRKKNSFGALFALRPSTPVKGFRAPHEEPPTSPVKIAPPRPRRTEEDLQFQKEQSSLFSTLQSSMLIRRRSLDDSFSDGEY